MAATLIKRLGSWLKRDCVCIGIKQVLHTLEVVAQRRSLIYVSLHVIEVSHDGSRPSGARVLVIRSVLRIDY